VQHHDHTSIVTLLAHVPDVCVLELQPCIIAELMLLLDHLCHVMITVIHSVRAQQVGYGRSAMERLMTIGTPYTMLQVSAPVLTLHFTHISAQYVESCDTLH
jgi:hypothetical protein